MEKYPMTEEDRSALTRIGVPLKGPIHAPFQTDRASQYNTLKQRITRDSQKTQSDGPGQVGVLVYVKEFPRAQDPSNPQPGEIQDAVLAELQKSELIYLDYSHTAVGVRNVWDRRPKTQEGPVKVYGNQEAHVLTNELWELVNYIREIKNQFSEIMGGISSHGIDLPDLMSVAAGFTQQMNLVTLRETLFAFPNDARWALEKAWNAKERPWHNRGNVLVHRQGVARELVSLLSSRWWTLDSERTTIRHCLEQVFIAKFGASTSNMVGIVRQCYLDQPYRNEEMEAMEKNPDPIRWRMTECVRFIDAYQSWMFAIRCIWGHRTSHNYQWPEDLRKATEVNSPLMQAIYREYDDFMDGLFTAAKMLQAKATRQDISNQLTVCEQHSHVLHHSLTHHPQHLRLKGGPKTDSQSDTTPAERSVCRSIRPVEASEMRRIEGWYAARYTEPAKVRPLAIYRAMLPAEERMGMRRKEPELADPQTRVMTKASKTAPRGGGLGTFGGPGNTARPATAPSASAHIPQSWAGIAAPPGSQPPPATTASTSASNSSSWAGIAATPSPSPATAKRTFQLHRGGGRNSTAARPRGGKASGKNPQGNNSWGGNAWGGNPSTLEDATDSSEGESFSRGDGRYYQGGNSWGGNAWGGKPPTLEDVTDSSEGDEKAQRGRESLRHQTATRKRRREFDSAAEEVVRTTKRHRLGGVRW